MQHKFLILLSLFTLFLGACSSSTPDYNWERNKPSQPTRQPQKLATPGQAPQIEKGLGPYASGQAANDKDGTVYPTVKIGLLLPLSGENAPLGKSMLQAAQLALFDLGADTFELLPRDTGGTPEGAMTAANDVLMDGAQLILGPLYSASVKAVKPLAASKNVNLISFSTDWTVAGGNAYIMGFTPFTQVARIAAYARRQGLGRIALITTQDAYGSAVEQSFQEAARTNGLTLLRTIRVPAGVNTVADPQVLTALAQQKPEAVLLALGGTQAASISTMLDNYGMKANLVQRLGTGLWDDETLVNEPALDGGWFAAASPLSRRQFEENYKNLYGMKPERLASLAYDATALAAVLAKMGQAAPNSAFSRTALTNPSGFSGIDGIFRFDDQGRIARGLAILEFQNGRIVEIDPAPRRF